LHYLITAEHHGKRFVLLSEEVLVLCWFMTVYFIATGGRPGFDPVFVPAGRER
jgi:hypothetical protein